jgi:hypothetical protein
MTAAASGAIATGPVASASPVTKESKSEFLSKYGTPTPTEISRFSIPPPDIACFTSDNPAEFGERIIGAEYHMTLIVTLTCEPEFELEILKIEQELDDTIIGVEKGGVIDPCLGKKFKKKAKHVILVYFSIPQLPEDILR